MTRAQQDLSCGQPVSGSLGSGATHSFRHSSPAGTAVVVQASSLSASLRLVRLVASGPGVDENTCSGVLEFVSGGGTVNIEVSPCLAGDSGSYTLTLQVVSAGAANCALPLTCGLTPLGTELSVPGEVDSFRFSVSAGTQVRLSFEDEEGLDQAYRLRLFDPVGKGLLDGTNCADDTTVTLANGGVHTALVSSCAGLRTSSYRIERYDSSCPRGPEITFMGLLPQNQQIDVSTLFDAQGRPIYFGERGLLVIEARPGESGVTVGDQAYTPPAAPDLQLIVDQDLGDGSLAVCDLDPPGGVPASNPFVFSDTPAAIGRLNDLGCRVDNGMSIPIGHRSELDACPRDSRGQASFVSPDTTVEFCLPIPNTLAFAAGDTIVKARVRDQRQQLSAEREIVVRVATRTPTSTPTATPTPTHTPTRTPTQRMATPTRTPFIRTPGPCTGDCDEDGNVTVAELTRAVRIALGQLALPACPLADGNHDGEVKVADLIGAVRNALFDCPPPLND